MANLWDKIKEAVSGNSGNQEAQSSQAEPTQQSQPSRGLGGRPAASQMSERTAERISNRATSGKIKVNPLAQAAISANKNYKQNRFNSAAKRLTNAQNSLGYVTDPWQEADARSELDAAQKEYDVAKKEYEDTLKNIESSEESNKFSREAQKDLGIQTNDHPLTDADYRQMDVNDAWSPNWENGEKTRNGIDAGKILDWGKNVVKGAAEGTASGFAGAQRALYEGGQRARTEQTLQDLNETAYSLVQQIYASRNDPDGDAESYDYVIDSIQKRLKAYADVLGPDVYDQVLKNLDKAYDDFEKGGMQDFDILRYALQDTTKEKEDTGFLGRLRGETATDTTKLDLSEPGIQQQATKQVSEYANELSEDSAKHVQYAKKVAGDTFAGNLITDVAVNGLQMAGDAALALLVGPGTQAVSLGSMGLRTFGSSAQEAEANNADILQQLGYGTVKAGIEVGTELMFDGLAGIYGKGGADEIVEEVIRKISHGNEAAMTGLRVMFGAIGEGAEEGVSGIADPLAKAIYQGIQSIPEGYSKEQVADILYDMLVGAASGGAFSTVSAFTPQNTEANARLRDTDTIQATLEEAGVSKKEASTAASALYKAINGEELTKADAKKLRGNNLLYNTMFGLNLDENGKPNQSIVSATEQARQEAESQEQQENADPAEQLRSQIQQIQDYIDKVRGDANASPQLIKELTDRQQMLTQQLNQLEEAQAQVEAQAEAQAEQTEEQGTAPEEEQPVETAQPTTQPSQPAPAPIKPASREDTDSGTGASERSVQERLDRLQQMRQTAVEEGFGADYIAQLDEKIAQLANEAGTGEDVVTEESTTTTETAPEETRPAPSPMKPSSMEETDSGTGTQQTAQPSETLADALEESTNQTAQTQETQTQETQTEQTEQNEQAPQEQTQTTETAETQEGTTVAPETETTTETNTEAQTETQQTEQTEQTNQEQQTETQEQQSESPQSEQASGTTAETESVTAPETNTTSETTVENAPESQRTADAIQADIEMETQTIDYLQRTNAPQYIIQEHQQRLDALNAELNGETSAPAPTGPWTPPVNQNGKPKTKVSQTSTNSMRNTAEMNGATQDAITYITKPEIESLNNAMNRAATDMVGEMNNLLAKDSWTGEDIDTAFTIYGKLKYDSVQTRDSTAADAWAKVVQEHGTTAGRALQAMGKWARTGTAVAAATDTAVNNDTSLTDEQKTIIKNTVFEVAEEFDGIKDGDFDAIINLILKQNNIRETGTLNPKSFENILRKVKDFDWLKEFALRQMMAIPSDYTNTTDLGSKIKTWQVNAQLSRLGTFFRNLGGNATFGLLDTMSQNLLGNAIDTAVSKYTGRKEVGFDSSWLSGKARNAATDAMYRSILEIAGDVDMTGDTTRYGVSTNRTNKMVGNEFERVMSRWEQILGYSLTTSDRTFRGQIETSFADGLRRANENLPENKKLSENDIAELAKQMADYRLFQNHGTAAKLSKGVHDLFNLVGVGGEVRGNSRIGGFGVGDLINPYPGVPANLAVKALEYSPANIIKGGVEIVKLLQDAKTGESVNGQQMQAVMDIARGMTGVPVITLFTALAKSGLFKNSDDEDDYDVAAENAAQGLSGVQWNLSATQRAMNGEGNEWKNGDQLMKVSWLEPFNAFMSIGSLIANSVEDRDLSSYANKYFEGTLQSVLDLPVMTNIQNAVNTFKYSTGENLWEKGIEAGAQFAGDAAGGMIPAPVSQLARVTDDYVRDTKGDSKAETALNSLYNSLPGVRNTLPIKTDNFGNDRLNEPNAILRTLNSFVLPGAINTFMETEAQDEVSRLYEATGETDAYPDRAGPKSIKSEGTTYKLTADEQREYHSVYGKAAEKYVNDFIKSKYYKNLTDDQKVEALKDAYSFAKDAANAEYFKSKDIYYTSKTQDLLHGVDDPGTDDDKTALQSGNVADYLAFKTQYDDALKAGDYKTVDKVLGMYNGMNKNMKTVVTERLTDFKHLNEYRSYGVDSKDYYAVKNAVLDAQEYMDKSSNQGGDVQFLGLINADVSNATKTKLIEKGDFLTKGRKSAYDILKPYGFSLEEIYNFYDEADHKVNKQTGEVETKGKGSLDAAEAAYAISLLPGLTNQQRTEIYGAMKKAMSNYYNDWGRFTYSSELNYINGRSKYTYGKTGKISKTVPGKKTSGSTSGGKFSKAPMNPIFASVSSKFPKK